MAKPIDLLRKVVVGDVSPLCHWFSHKNTQPRHATQHAHASNLFQTEHRTPTASCTPAYSFELPSVPGPSSLSDLWRNYPIRLSNSIPRRKPAQLHVQKYSLVAPGLSRWLDQPRLAIIRATLVSVPTRRLHYPLIQEYTLNYRKGPYYDLRCIPY